MSSSKDESISGEETCVNKESADYRAGHEAASERAEELVDLAENTMVASLESAIVDLEKGRVDPVDLESFKESLDNFKAALSRYRGGQS